MEEQLTKTSTVIVSTLLCQVRWPMNSHRRVLNQVISTVMLMVCCFALLCFAGCLVGWWLVGWSVGFYFLTILETEWL